MSKKANAKTESEDSDADSLRPLFEAMLTLLGRLVYPPEKIREIVTKSKRKKDPKDYVKAYNLCDGGHTLSQIAEAIDVAKGTLSPILSEWKELGIIYETTKKGGQFYKRLYRLGPKSTGTSDEEDEMSEPSEAVVTKDTNPPEQDKAGEDTTQAP